MQKKTKEQAMEIGRIDGIKAELIKTHASDKVDRVLRKHYPFWKPNRQKRTKYQDCPEKYNEIKAYKETFIEVTYYYWDELTTTKGILKGIGLKWLLLEPYVRIPLKNVIEVKQKPQVASHNRQNINHKST